MADFIVIAIVVLVTGAAALHIRKARKKGSAACIGCPGASGCTGCSGCGVHKK